MKKALIALALAALLAVPAAAQTFTDVPESEWYYADVEKAYADGLVNGKTADTYAPDANLTYAEAVKLAACMNQKHAAGIVTLENGNPWYQSYADYAKEAGIIAGDLDWTANATRAGYMAVFAHALPSAALTPINDVPDGSIPDVPMTHPQAAEIYLLYRAGILQGSDAEHNCKPADNIKRSEVAAILTRMMDPSARKSFAMAAAPVAPEPPAAGTLSGVFAEKDGTSIMAARIEGDTIRIYMVNIAEGTQMLYWVGTFEQPNGRAEYTFDSVKNEEETRYAIFASQDATKTITVKGGEISFTWGMLGVTATARMTQADDGILK